MGYSKYYKANSYTKAELISQASRVVKRFPNSTYQFKRSQLVLKLKLKPTEESIEYTIVIRAYEGSKIVRIFVTNPKVELFYKGQLVPHLYRNGALCLYYPKYNEWDYRWPWADTLIPWTSLWLYFYEIWQETGEWLGEGIHGKKPDTQ